MKKNFIYITASLLLALASLITSCKDLIYDDLSDCPGGLYVHFYSQTECAEQRSYPQEVKQLNVFVFDKNNILVRKILLEDQRLSKDYTVFVPLKSAGLYSVIAWAGLDERFFDVRSSEIGKTTKQTVLTQLKQSGKMAQDLKGQTLWTGISETVLAGTPEQGKEQYPRAEVNLREFTNRITVSLTHAGKQAEDYVIELASCNSVYRYDGSIPACDSTYYPTKMTYTAQEEGTASAFFTTLKLESGHKNTLILRNRKTGRELFREDLVGVILLSPSAANINLRCLNDFDVKLRLRPCDGPDGYMVSEIRVNDWLVHSYDTPLDPNT